MGFEPGDRIRHRDQKGFVLLVHEDGALNLIHGTPWSTNSDGIWPPEARERVDPDAVVPGWEDPDAVEDVEDDATSTATTGSGDAATTEAKVPADERHNRDEEDFDGWKENAVESDPDSEASDEDVTDESEPEDVDLSTQSAASDDVDETEGDGEWSPDFDPDAFVDRTPMSEVIDDLETGEYDDVLDLIEDAEEDGRDRDGVADAIEARR